jgi:hypothetical protein
MPVFTIKGVVTDDSGNSYDLKGTLAPVAQEPPPQPDPQPQPEPKPEPKADPQPPAAVSAIPLSPQDPRFKNNASWTNGVIKRGTFANKSWNDGPNYGRGEPCFTWGGNGSDVLTLSQCLVDAREGPRIGAGSSSNPMATLNINESFINCVGKGKDHADGVQAYSPGGKGIINIKRTCLRNYSDKEARDKYGSGFIGSAGFFWADAMQGEVNFEDVVVWGGGRGVAIYADTGATRVSFKNVFFVPGPDGWTAWAYDIRATGGKLAIDRWENVCEARIVDGKLVAGKPMPRPA